MTTASTSPTTSRDFAGLSLGWVGMWWFLASEIMVFGGLIGSYILSRIAAGGWAAETSHVNTRLAVVNTVVLLTSSLTMVLAHHAVTQHQAERARLFLLCTVVLGSLFLCIKGFEYRGEIQHGFTPASGLFWSYYYTMTGLHGLHVVIGVLINAALCVRVGGSDWPRLEPQVEYAGLYWHFVDVVWIFLFPLLYLA